MGYWIKKEDAPKLMSQNIERVKSIPYRETPPPQEEIDLWTELEKKPGDGNH